MVGGGVERGLMTCQSLLEVTPRHGRIGRSGVGGCCNFLNPPFQVPVVLVNITPFHR